MAAIGKILIFSCNSCTNYSKNTTFGSLLGFPRFPSGQNHIEDNGRKCVAIGLTFYGMCFRRSYRYVNKTFVYFVYADSPNIYFVIYVKSSIF